MPEFRIDFEVFCNTCGEGLCGSSTVEQSYGVPRLFVEVCKNCLDNLRERKDEEIELEEQLR